MPSWYFILNKWNFLNMKLLLLLILCVNSAMAKNSVIYNEVIVDDVSTKIMTYKSKNMTNNPILVIALHGDAPFHNPSYQYRFAETVSKLSENVVSIGMLRPGYMDHLSRISDGIRGDAIGDNYDDIRIEQIAKAIESLKLYYNSRKVILAGHSGGAAISAKLISLYPKLVDHAFIVSCPCNIPAWRADMYKISKYEGFKGDLGISSPIDLVSQISDDTKINIYFGNKDETAKPYLSLNYEKALKSQGKQVQSKELEGGHNIFLNDEIIQSLVGVIGT